MRRCLYLFLTLFLVACGSGERPIYRIASVLPSPALPGSSITVFGVLPDNATVELAGEVVSVTKVSGGVSFDLPEWMSAGVKPLRVNDGGPGLTGVVQVQPRLDSATFQGRTLRVRGAGWPSEAEAATSVQVLLGNDLLEPSISTGQLEVLLEAGAEYGRFAVKVRVNGQLSKPLSVSREAGALAGTVILPAMQELPSPEKMLTVQQTPPDPTAFIVYGKNEAPATGLERTDKLPLLDAVRLEYTTSQHARAAFASLRTQGAVLEWDQVVSADGSELVTLSNSPQGEQWFHTLANLDSAWENTLGAGVVVAVLDTGVELEHPDLKANLLPGYDFVDPGSEPYDFAGHGTHVAGLIAANGMVKGTAPEASLLPVRVLEGLSGGSAFAVAQGILWAAGLLEEPVNPTPAQIINMSLGANSFIGVIAEAVAKAQAAGVIVIAATGNAGGPVAYPAALPGVIAVTALAGPKLAYQPVYANKGTGTYLTAFGGDTTQDQNEDSIPDGILSTDLDGYSLRMGTSMASPQAAGLAALALARGVKPEHVSATLASTAGELGVMGFDPLFGYGLASGRAVTTRDPRTYVVALEPETNTLISWTVLQEDLSFVLNNLEPGVSINVQALSDEDGDGVLGEAGEFASSTKTLNPESSEVETLSLTLNPTDGTQRITLEARP